MKFFVVFVAIIICSFGCSSICNADLMLDITGVGGSNLTTWTFSGSFEAGAPEAFNTDFGVFPTPQDSIFAEQGDMFRTGWSHTNVVPPGGVTVTTPNGTRGIDLLYLNELGVTDEIGMTVDGTTDLQFASGDTVSWAGSVDLAIDITEMNEGSYNNDYFAFIFGTLELTVNISEDTAAVPEPSSMFIGLVAIGLFTRRRRTQ